MLNFILDIKPDESTSSRQKASMLIEKIPSIGLIVIYGIFGLLVLVSVLAAYFGPPVWQEISASSWLCPANQTSFVPGVCFGRDLGQGQTWQGQINNLNKLNQAFRLVATIESSLYDTVWITKEYSFSLAMSGRAKNGQWEEIIKEEHKRTIVCDLDSLDCANLTIIYEPYLSYSDYSINVTITDATQYDFMGDTIFTFRFVNEKYTLFEMWFRFLFLLVSFFSLILLTFRMRNYVWGLWKTEQRWTTILLFGVMCYDNPLFPMEILISGWFFPFLDQLLTVSFVVLLLFFLLVMLDSIRLKAETDNPITWQDHIIKGLMMLMIWIACVVVWAWIEFNNISDPEYSSPTDVPYFTELYYLLVVLGIMYLLYLFYIAARSIVAIRKGGYWQRRITFFLVITTIVIFISIFGMVIQVLTPKHRHDILFMKFPILLSS